MHDDLSATRSLSLCFPPLLCSPNHYFLKQKIEEAEWVVQACDLCSCVLRARNCWSSPLVLWVVARRLPGEGPHARTGVPCFLSCEKCEPPLRAMVVRACLPVIPVGGQACHLLVVQWSSPVVLGTKVSEKKKKLLSLKTTPRNGERESSSSVLTPSSGH